METLECIKKVKKKQTDWGLRIIKKGFRYVISGSIVLKRYFLSINSETDYFKRFNPYMTLRLERVNISM